MRLRRVVPVAVVLLAVTAAPSLGQVIEGPDGPVEFVGLQEWTARELFDAIQELAPGQPFHACAAVMERDLGFADAAAMSYRTTGSDEVYTVVVGVEDATRVRPRTIGSDTLVLPEALESLKALGEEDPGLLSLAAQVLYARADADRTAEVAGWTGVDAEALAEVWSLLDRADGRRDDRLALELLERDSSWETREIAAFVLSNFPDRDATWHALVLSMTDPEGRVGAMAGGVLRGLTASGESLRPVDWAPAEEPLLALFDGTNPWHFSTTLRVLVATGIAPEFGRRLARERPDLLLAYAGAEHRGTRAPAITFLQAISGEDFGTDVEAWAEWIHGQPD
ncbi:MAG: hypothetical protein OXI39_02770 [Gemmatimonadota bacterium]|uniref:hypothetical protein n=1 Tax=Candidatus Palauibacter scopulicola TaxID=3056741 RepID=UPI0023856E48|nr:hypothetical protein [Candidatus Palauibacter scopulicola]MDE2661915.1 hypothetical protein [Candidatus Palauibacter scopulicola]